MASSGFYVRGATLIPDRPAPRGYTVPVARHRLRMLAELWRFLREERRAWLLPLVVLLVLLTLLAVALETPALAPFLYPLF